MVWRRWPVGRAARPLPFCWSQGRGWELEGDSSHRGRVKCQGSGGVHPPVIHYGRDADTGQGSDFTFRGLWCALPWICIFRMSVYTRIPSVFSQWSPYNQSGRWYHMCKTNRDHKNTYLSKLVLQAVVVSQINFACFQNWSSGEQKAGKDVRRWFLI